MYTNNYRPLYRIIIGLWLGVSFSMIYAQPKESDLPRIELLIQTVFDDSSSHTDNFKKYFNAPKGNKLAELVSDQTERVIKATFEDMAVAIDVKIVDLNEVDKKNIQDYTYALKNVLFLKSNMSMVIKSSLRHLKTDRNVDMFENVLKKTLLLSGDWWYKLEANQDTLTSDLEKEQILNKMASSIVAVIDDNIVKWIIESVVRIRVKVKPFVRIGEDQKDESLGVELSSLLESELTGSESIVVYAQAEEDTTVTKPLLNYVIDGQFFEIGGKLRVDVRCLKKPSLRILLSQKVIVDSITVTHLSGRMAELGHQLIQSMEADFKTANKTLAVVAKPPVRIFSFKGPQPEDITITKEITRTITQKLRLLSVDSRNFKSVLDLQILDNPEKVLEYINRPAAPSEILSDLNVDYLVVVCYEDLGTEVRLSVNLHSYDVERPAIAKFMFEDKEKKIRVNHLIDRSAVEILRTLCRMGLVTTSLPCDHLSADIQQSKNRYIYTGEAISGILKESLPNDLYTMLDTLKINDIKKMKHSNKKERIRQALDTVFVQTNASRYRPAIYKHIDRNAIPNRIREIQVPNIRKFKGMGIRVGATNHDEPSMFFEKNSSPYFEIFFSYIFPNCRWKWFDFGVEPSFGYNPVRALSVINGVISANGFINLKAILSIWDNWNVPLIFSVGGGVGTQGIRYAFSPGDSGYSGTKPYFNGKIIAAYNIFTEIEFPTGDRFRFHALLRYIGTTKKIDEFQSVSVDTKNPPLGKLDGIYFVCGIKYAWR